MVLVPSRLQGCPAGTQCFPLLILMTPVLTENKTYSSASLPLLAQGLGLVLALTGALGQASRDILELVMMQGQSLEAFWGL